MAFDLTKLNAAFTNMAAWVVAGLAKKADATATSTALGTKANASDLSTTNQNVTNLTNTVNGKQSTILTGTAAPDNSVGNNGDVYMVTDS